MISTEEYLRTPATNQVHELWHGMPKVAESPTSWHQGLAFEIAVAIRSHVRARGLGKVWLAPLDVILDHDRAVVLQPDVAYVSWERLHIATGALHRVNHATGPSAGAPDHGRAREQIRQLQ